MSDAAPPLFVAPALAELFSARAVVEAMLRVEGALARAQARGGVIPAAAAEAITAACRIDDFDADAIFAESASAGTPAIPLVRRLTERVPPDARGWVHWGATSQDVVDTATMLQMRAALELLEHELHRAGESAAALAERHRRTVMAGRTLLQQAVPITFGLKAARWLALVTRQLDALRALREETLALQLGGAAGTLASYGDAGPAVAMQLATELELPLPDLPWHAERDRIAVVAATLGVTAGAMSKIAGDVLLLAQTEVGEVAEGAAPGKGGSSAMPHKRNPVDAVAAVAAARLAIALVPTLLAGMAQEHERAAGAWQVEWVAVPHVFRHTGAAVTHVARMLAGLEVFAERMRANLELGGGASMAESLSIALAATLGRVEAQALAGAVSERAQREGITLRDAATAEPRIAAVMTEGDLARALDPVRYLGSTDAFIDRALAAFRRSS